MMKSTFFNIFLFTVLIASCAPQGTPAQVTATSIPTTIPTQTATPLVIVSGSGSLREFNEEALMAFAQESGVFLSPSNQPYAEQGIVLDVDGKLWLFDENTQKMVDMNIDPSWDVQSMSSGDGENLTITLSDGKQFDFIDGKWVEIVTEKVYASGVDPELEAEVVSDATKAIVAMGETFTNVEGDVVPVETIADKIQLEIQKGNYDSMIVLDKGTGNYISDLLVLETRKIDISTLPGGKRGDYAVNVYGAQENNEDVPVPTTIFYVRGGQFYPTLDFQFRSLESKVITKAQTLEEYQAILDEYIQPGRVVKVRIQTFATVNTEEELIAINAKRFTLGRMEANVLQLLRLQDNDYMERLTELDIVKAAKLLDPEKLDIGLFSGYMVIKR